MSPTTRLLAAVAVLHVGAYAPVVGQSPPSVSLHSVSAIAFRNSRTPAGNDRSSGLVLGVGGTVRLGRAFLDVKYLEGSLSSGTGNIENLLVEGELLVGFYTTPWLAVKTGLHLRSFVTGAFTERWVLWVGRVQAEGELYVPDSGAFSLHSYFEGRLVVTGDASVVDRYDRGSGAEGGMIVRLPGGPFHGRLAYRIDHDRLASGVRQETVETLILTVGVSLRR